MKEVLMTYDDILEEIEFEDKCGVNDFLQSLLCSQKQGKEYRCYHYVNKKDEVCGWVIRDKKTGEDLHL